MSMHYYICEIKNYEEYQNKKAKIAKIVKSIEELISEYGLKDDPWYYERDLEALICLEKEELCCKVWRDGWNNNYFEIYWENVIKNDIKEKMQSNKYMIITAYGDIFESWDTFSEDLKREDDRLRY